MISDDKGHPRRAEDEDSEDYVSQAGALVIHSCRNGGIKALITNCAHLLRSNQQLQQENAKLTQEAEMRTKLDEVTSRQADVALHKTCMHWDSGNMLESHQTNSRCSHLGTRSVAPHTSVPLNDASESSRLIRFHPNPPVEKDGLLSPHPFFGCRCPVCSYLVETAYLCTFHKYDGSSVSPGCVVLLRGQQVGRVLYVGHDANYDGPFSQELSKAQRPIGVTVFLFQTGVNAFYPMNYILEIYQIASDGDRQKLGIKMRHLPRRGSCIELTSYVQENETLSTGPQHHRPPRGTVCSERRHSWSSGISYIIYNSNRSSCESGRPNLQQSLPPDAYSTSLNLTAGICPQSHKGFDNYAFENDGQVDNLGNEAHCATCKCIAFLPEETVFGAAERPHHHHNVIGRDEMESII